MVLLKLSLLELDVEEKIVIHEDNQACMRYAKNSNFHGRAKHISIRYNFVKEFVNQEDVELVYCPSEKMKADIFTKGLSLKKFEELRRMINVYKETWRSIEGNEVSMKTQ